MQMLSHIGFIMDGNRRWAKEHLMTVAFGHKQGAETAKEIVHFCIKKGIPHITLWALSTDNWKKRDQHEVEYIFKLIDEIPRYFSELKDLNTSLDFIGNRTGLPIHTQENMKTIEKDFFQHNAKFHVHIALNYGGREELLQCMNKIRSIGKESITEDDVASLLYTKDIPDIDLIIRTGGHRRLSGFMPWQSIYAELFFSDTYWPALGSEEVDRAITIFLETERKFGK